MHLDTHVVDWLFAGSVGVFPPTVRALLDSEPLSVSPMVSLAASRSAPQHSPTSYRPPPIFIGLGTRSTG